MENLKIRVNNEAESKEAQELFLEYDATGSVCLHKSIRYVCTFKGVLTQYEFLPSVEFKQITLPQLKDMVVLKRNDVGDASHINCDGQYMYEASVGNWYLYHNNAWKSDGVDIDDMPKPIEKTMKEYLDPRNGYKLIEAPESEALELHASEWILVPEGAIKSRFYPKDPDDLEFENNSKQWWDNEEQSWVDYGAKEYADSEKYSRVVWNRHNQPEELPFINDEQSLNDQYAEIEKVREKHSHYKKDISHLEVLDVYRVLDLFNVTNPCIQHAVKKLLCSGQRGVKDSDRDVNEAIDSLQRYNEMKIEDENSSED